MTTDDAAKVLGRTHTWVRQNSRKYRLGNTCSSCGRLHDDLELSQEDIGLLAGIPRGQKPWWHPSGDDALFAWYRPGRSKAEFEEMGRSITDLHRSLPKGELMKLRWYDPDRRCKTPGCDCGPFHSFTYGSLAFRLMALGIASGDELAHVLSKKPLPRGKSTRKSL